MARFVSRLFSFGPRIFKENDQLHAVTGWRVWLMTLGLANRLVIVDPVKKVLRIHDRILWFIPKARRFKFDHIRAVAYGYSDANSFGGFNFVRDTYDFFSVGIKLHGDSDIHQHLFRFFGEGSFVNEGPFPDWWYWEEYLTDVAGTQESESRRFVDLLYRMTRTTIEPW